MNYGNVNVLNIFIYTPHLCVKLLDDTSNNVDCARLRVFLTFAEEYQCDKKGDFLYVERS